MCVERARARTRIGETLRNNYTVYYLLKDTHAYTLPCDPGPLNGKTSLLPLAVANASALLLQAWPAENFPKVSPCNFSMKLHSLL